MQKALPNSIDGVLIINTNNNNGQLTPGGPWSQPSLLVEERAGNASRRERAEGRRRICTEFSAQGTLIDGFVNHNIAAM